MDWFPTNGHPGGEQRYPLFCVDLIYPTHFLDLGLFLLIASEFHPNDVCSHSILAIDWCERNPKGGWMWNEFLLHSLDMGYIRRNNVLCIKSERTSLHGIIWRYSIDQVLWKALKSIDQQNDKEHRDCEDCQNNSWLGQKSCLMHSIHEICLFVIIPFFLFFWISEVCTRSVQASKTKHQYLSGSMKTSSSVFYPWNDNLGIKFWDELNCRL